MKFSPQQYAIADEPMKPFIDKDEIYEILRNTKPDAGRVREVIAKSLAKNRLSLHETAVLLNAGDPALIEEIKQAARTLKENIYGERIVLFAPLYIGNKCVNNCLYCGFRVTNKEQVRSTLTTEEIIQNVEALEDNGHKRLILVFGEHPDYEPGYIADVVKTVYAVKKGPGEIRRVNINAAPMSIEGFKTVKEAGIGTYQVFQETYHPGAYKEYHQGGRKADFENRLTSLDRAQEAGLDDVGIGTLFGLYDWRYEVMAMVRHTNHLEACYNVGPHTISFPRIKDASNNLVKPEYLVSDEAFVHLIAVLRLAVPYTGMILTAREPAGVRKEVLKYGCSQIDAGTKIEIGAYSNDQSEIDLTRGQFAINDNRSLREVIDELIDTGNIPSFCTACYRLKRTGEHFMEFSVPGFIKRFCQPNALLTLAEYLEDYAPQATKQKGYTMIGTILQQFDDGVTKPELLKRLEAIKLGERDLYF